VLLVLSALSCGGPAKAPEVQVPRGEWRTFGGTGTSSGRAQTLRLGPGHTVSIISLNGSLVLTGERGLGQGFRSETIGLFDSLKGGTSWSVWTDSRGDQVYSEVRGGAVGTGNRFVGTLQGGTGIYAGATGEYEFEWQYVVRSEDGTIHGRTVGLRGRFRGDVPAPPPDRKSSRGKAGCDHGRA